MCDRRITMSLQERRIGINGSRASAQQTAVEILACPRKNYSNNHSHNDHYSRRRIGLRCTLVVTPRHRWYTGDIGVRHGLLQPSGRYLYPRALATRIVGWRACWRMQVYFKSLQELYQNLMLNKLELKQCESANTWKGEIDEHNFCCQLPWRTSNCTSIAHIWKTFN